MGEIVLQILILIGAGIVGGLIYGLIMVQIDKYHSKKEAKEHEKFLKEGWKRYAEYRRKQDKARGRTKVK